MSLEELSETIPDIISVEDEVQTALLKKCINEFLSQQDKRNRILFIRRYWMGDSYEQLSALTGLKEGAVRTRLSRMRQKLKNDLTKKGVLS